MQPNWRDGCRAMTTVNGLFAGFSGALIGITIKISPPDTLMDIVIIFGVLAFWLFAWGAEKTTDALDENDVDKYVKSMWFYNFAVIIIFLSLAILLYSKTNSCLSFITFMLSCPWIVDILFLMNKRKMCDYRTKLLASSHVERQDH